MNLKTTRLHHCDCSYCRSKAQRLAKVLIISVIVVIGVAVALVPKIFG